MLKFSKGWFKSFDHSPYIDSIYNKLIWSYWSNYVIFQRKIRVIIWKNVWK